jgi:two-component system, LytTR family, sensor kinase
MNPWKPAKIEWITFFALIPVLLLLMNRLLFENAFISKEVLTFSYPVIFIYIFASWYLHVTVMHILRLRFPAFKQTYRRIILLFSAHIFLTSSSLFLIFWTFDYFHVLGYEIDYSKTKWCLVIGILLTVVATGAWEGSYIYQLWLDSLREKELLQKKTLQSEFDALKSQVNPHFLFNSLNSLSSLIHENPEDAEKFLDEMSKVYRYILKNNEDSLIDLGTEIKFLNSYYHLLKTRHSDGFNMQLAVDEELNEYFIPPLTLQLLLENAVKHNIILKEEPLNISIVNEGDEKLIIKNNLQKKSSKVQSNKVGLANIASKYRLLGYDEITISETASDFIVSIPLIKNK